MRLFNAHRRVLLRLPKPRALEPGVDPRFRFVSEDVQKWVEKAAQEGHPLSEKELSVCLRDPQLYFNRPRNVPLELRKQVYLPDFVVTLIRTPHLPPRYAQFWVPLWFNKLDLKDYLKRVYDVDVLHVRSYVQEQKVQRGEPIARGVSQTTEGPLYKPNPKKKMTAELVKTFVWPDEIEDFTPWEKDTYHAARKDNEEYQKSMSPQKAYEEPPGKDFKSIAEQAQDLLKGKEKWRPSWEAVPVDAKAMSHDAPPTQ